jgi:hypothetical protein
MDLWTKAYSRILSTSIGTITWYPIAVDTPDLVRDMEQSSFSYSGGALIVSENGQKVFLTWWWQDGQYCLAVSEKAENNWLVLSLDRIGCRWNGPWEEICDSAVSGVRFYAEADDRLQRIVGVKHLLTTKTGSQFMWIATGGDRLIGDVDDLWVSVGVEPDNLAGLVEIAHLDGT